MTRPTCSSSSQQDQQSSPTRSSIPPRKSPSNLHRRRGRSVFSLLVQREILPRSKFVPKKRWGQSRWFTSENLKEAEQSLLSWVEAESLQHLSAKYCNLGPPPRSTIAAAFSSDGRTIASTHGDHTVKIIDYETGNCLRVLSGHRRTPWVVRFHPRNSEIVASGSLDESVRLWNTTTSVCTKSHEFNRPIASIAFHAEGDLLAVASGHKLYMWYYDKRGQESPIVVLKTRRSLRAVHFHPHGAPYLLTAEVNEINSLDSATSRATTTTGYSRQYPPPDIFFTTPTESMNVDEPPTTQPTSQIQNRTEQLGQIQQLFRLRDRVSWDLPFLQGWLMAQGQGVSAVPPSAPSRLSTTSLEAAVALLEIPSRNAQPVVNRVQSELAAAAASELPCTVKLNVWSHEIKEPYAQMKPVRCLLTIPHAVLCSEMGAHFSPCGRYLAACVACVFPHTETLSSQQESGLATSPTRHPVTAHKVMYELRVYSLQKESFGSVLVSRAIRAAHCLTSIQFSPTSEHIMLAYGRRHGSLLKSIVSDGSATSHFFTVLEIYRVSDMEIVRVLPSAEDEVNVACFHPSPGGGLVYGTKEGKLRVFKYNTAASSDFTGPNTYPEEHLSKVQTHAMEC